MRIYAEDRFKYDETNESQQNCIIKTLISLSNKYNEKGTDKKMKDSIIQTNYEFLGMSYKLRMEDIFLIEVSLTTVLEEIKNIEQ